MTKLKKAIAIGTMVLTLSATSLTAFAASNYQTPAEAVAGLTGKTVESVLAERAETGKTYGTIANEAGKLEEFKGEMLEIKKDALAEKVADGVITQEKADRIIETIEENQANCDGTASAKSGMKMGAGVGGMNDGGQGKGQRGFGRGQGNCTGSCQVQP